MAWSIKDHLVKTCFVRMAFTAVAFFSPMIDFAPAPIWFKDTALASHDATAPSAQTTRCDDDDYQYVRITGNTSSLSIVDAASNNLHLDARETLWTHRHRPIIIRASTKICWDGGVIYGYDATSTTRRSHNPYARQTAVMQIIGYDQYADVAIHRIGFFDVASPITINGSVKAVTISDSRFYNALGDCIRGTIDGNLIIKSSLIEGCNITVKSRHFSRGRHSRRHVLRIGNNLIRIAAKPARSANPLGFAYENPTGSMGNLPIEAHGNIFLVENQESTMLLGKSFTDNLTDCSDNIVVWLGVGEYPSRLPDCFSVTNDSNVWEEARNSWMMDHEFAGQLDADLSQSNEGGESPHRGEAESRVGSEGEADAQRSLEPGSRGDAALAGLRAPTLRTLSVPQRTRRDKIGSPWSDGTLWSDGTGFADFSRGSLVSCRGSQGLRPMTGSTVCSP